MADSTDPRDNRPRPPRPPNLEQAETSPGGSPIFRYPPSPGPRFGFTDEPTTAFIRRREALYDELFGECEAVSHELMPIVPHIDVYVYRPGHAGRDFYTLITGGMSDLRMQAPRNASAPRAELIMYTREPKDIYIDLLRNLARFPHDQQTWFGAGHTMANGQPPAPLFDGSRLDTILFLDTILHPDETLPERLKIQGDRVDLLWVVPITSAECDLKLQRGLDTLLNLFDEASHPFILDERRRSYR